MSDLDTIVNVQVQITNTGVAKAGFGLDMVLSHNATFPERIRYYNQYADAVPTDFAADSPEGLAIAAILAQDTHPTQVAVGRATLSVTMRYAMAVLAVTAARTYGINVVGQGVTATATSYKTGTSKSLDLATKTTHVNTVVEAVNNAITPTLQFVADAVAKPGTITDVAGVVTVHYDPTVSQVSDVEALIATATSIRIRTPSTAPTTILTTPADVFAVTPLAVAAVTNDEIASNVRAMLNAVVGKNYLATLTGAAGAQTVVITGSAPGNWFSLEVTDVTALSNKMTHTGDPTADLAAIALVADPAFYCVHTLYNSSSYVTNTGTWCEANGKEYIVDVPETDAISTGAGNGDTLDLLFQTGNKRTLYNYYPSPAKMMSAALAGRLLSLNPGRWSAAFKSLNGPSKVSLTATQMNNLIARRANTYVRRGNRNVTLFGTVANTSYGFLDVVTGLDFLIDDIQTSVFGVLAGIDKVSYTDEDIELIAAAIRGCIARATSDEHKILSRGTPGSATDPVPTIVFPAVADIDPATRATRQLPNGVLVGRLQGAVHSVAMRLVITF